MQAHDNNTLHMLNKTTMTNLSVCVCVCVYYEF
jgi:hypothetical protein